ncbi:choice-of-anchor tandem repeat GloVer-containing protein [Comamonadaceae bacterium PP-2]
MTRLTSLSPAARLAALSLAATALSPISAWAQDPGVLSRITSFQYFGPDVDGGGGAMQGWPGVQRPTGVPLDIDGLNGRFLYVPVEGSIREYNCPTGVVNDCAGAGPSLARVAPVASHYERIFTQKDLFDVYRNAGGGTVGALVERANGDMVGALSPPATGARHADGSYSYGPAAEGLMGKGVLYRTDFDGAKASVIESTRGVVAYPLGPLVAASDGSVYGLDTGPGRNGRLFRLDAQERFTVVHEFAAAPGGGKQIPAGLILASDGWLYGVTSYWRGYPGMAGASTRADTPTGTMYRIDPANPASFEVLHTFTLEHGEILATDVYTGFPYTAGYVPDRSWLVEGGDGWLYGTTSVGSCATALADGAVNATSGPTAQNPICGNRYDWASNYAIAAYPHYDVSWNVHGTVYRIRKDGQGEMQILHRFGGDDGSTPSGPLALAADGAIYGTTASGGSHRSYFSAKRTTDTDRPFGTTCTPVREAAGQCEQLNSDGVLYRIRPSQIDVAIDGTVRNGGFELVRSFEKSVTGKTPIGVRSGSDGRVFGTTLYGGGPWTSSQSVEYQDNRYGTIFVYGPPAGASVTLTVTPAETAAGSRVLLTWTSSQAGNCQASSLQNDWTGAQDAQGTHEFRPASGVYNYTLTCTDITTGYRIASATQTLRVDAPSTGSDGNSISYGNGGGASGPVVLGLLGFVAWMRRRGRK